LHARARALFDRRRIFVGRPPPTRRTDKRVILNKRRGKCAGHVCLSVRLCRPQRDVCVYTHARIFFSVFLRRQMVPYNIINILYARRVTKTAEFPNSRCARVRRYSPPTPNNNERERTTKRRFIYEPGTERFPSVVRFIFLPDYGDHLGKVERESVSRTNAACPTDFRRRTEHRPRRPNRTRDSVSVRKRP